jgi:NADH:ubiquinone oxidoreductase subunit E
MITIIDLSVPRKLSCKALNNILFELKMKNIDIKAHGNIAILALLTLVQNNNRVIAQELEASQNLILEKSLKEAIELYGIPTIYTLYELYKIKSHIINYCKLKFNFKELK